MATERALSKIFKRLGMICLWTSVGLIVLLALLYLARIPLSIAVLESGSKDQMLSVNCLDWQLTLSPSIRINEVCLASDNIKLLANDINWPFLDNILDIQQLKVLHTPSQQIRQNGRSTFDLDGFKLPKNLPLVQVSNLVIDSYLLQKPFVLSIQQNSANSMLITGDIDAQIDLIETDSGNSLKAKIDWIPAKIITAIPQLKTILVTVDTYLGLQLWKNMPISSEFKMEGTKLYSAHKFAIDEQLDIAECKFDISIAGRFETVTSTDNLFTQIDLRQLPLKLGIADCEKLTIVNEDLAIKSLTLLVENPVEISPTQLTLSQIRIEEPLSSSNFSAVLQNAVFQFDNKHSKGQYQIHLDTPYSSAIAKAEIKSVISGEFSTEAEEVYIDFNTEQFELNNALFNAGTSAKIAKVVGNAKGQYRSGKFTASGILSSDNIQLVTPLGAADNDQAIVAIKSHASQFQLEESTAQVLKLALTNKISQIRYQNTSVAQINNQTWLILSDLNELEVTATSVIKKTQIADISVKSIAIEHKIHATINNSNNGFSSSGSHGFTLDTGIVGSLVHQITKDTKSLSIELPEQSVLPLQAQLAKINKDTTLLSGQLAGSLQYDISNSHGIGSLSLNALNLDYADYKIRGINMREKFTVDSAKLQLPDAKVSIDLVDAGVPINNIIAVVTTEKNILKLEKATGDIFGGTFALGEFWLDGRDQELKITAADLLLSELAALQQQSGINVTGEIGGNIPLLITAGDIKIDKGTLASEQPGTLRIKGNPAFDSIKENQQQLALLENLNYEKLETNIRLTPDGWLKLDFSILGNNPDKNQAINFNYGHEENIFTLLKALRITNAVQQGIENKIEAKYKNKDKTNKGNQ